MPPILRRQGLTATRRRSISPLSRTCCTPGCPAEPLLCSSWSPCTWLRSATGATSCTCPTGQRLPLEKRCNSSKQDRSLVQQRLPCIVFPWLGWRYRCGVGSHEANPSPASSLRASCRWMTHPSTKRFQEVPGPSWLLNRRVQTKRGF